MFATGRLPDRSHRIAPCIAGDDEGYFQSHDRIQNA
jgi:hypothetical protein